jgi:hypothetical protein
MRRQKNAKEFFLSFMILFLLCVFPAEFVPLTRVPCGNDHGGSTIPSVCRKNPDASPGISVGHRVEQGKIAPAGPLVTLPEGSNVDP